jgi:hypothetical protein
MNLDKEQFNDLLEVLAQDKKFYERIFSIYTEEHSETKDPKR